ncbi:MAG TPA: VanZ family protein [Micrococcales bacterium]|uniref:VanZ family protein n=1 Tax=Miniimonas arenae TaxID=676201 RepID=A0A5C5BFP3_9MICO|nr:MULTISPECIES: VanZ family protein [Miniimonas]TNU76148.1 VanZ family protein [Miniimonas arenae]HCX83604.1 VanZ family protein [Micrococcales bacterium]
MSPAPPSPRPGHRRAWAVAFVLALAVNLWVLYAPRVPGPPGGLRLDLLGHAATFAALTATGLLAGIPTRLLLAAVALNAVVSELVQHFFLPHRSGDVTDLAADVVGIALGVLLHRWFTARASRPPRA